MLPIFLASCASFSYTKVFNKLIYQQPRLRIVGSDGGRSPSRAVLVNTPGGKRTDRTLILGPRNTFEDTDRGYQQWK